MLKNLIREIIWVGLGGVIGALLRHGTNEGFKQLFGDAQFFTATTIENILGSFLIGLLFTYLSLNHPQKRMLQLFLLTGILGSYTTYSGFVAESFLLLQQSPLVFAGYLFSQVIFGVLAVLIGLKVAEKVTSS